MFQFQVSLGTFILEYLNHVGIDNPAANNLVFGSASLKFRSFFLNKSKIVCFPKLSVAWYMCLSYLEINAYQCALTLSLHFLNIPLFVSSVCFNYLIFLSSKNNFGWLSVLRIEHHLNKSKGYFEWQNMRENGYLQVRSAGFQGFAKV